MKEVSLGNTGITVLKSGFGALPVQRVNLQTAVSIIDSAYAGGIRFFDTAHSYTDSEEKLGIALKGKREDVFISTKTNDFTVDGFWENLKTSFKRLQTDYIDVYQFHNPSFCPKPDDGSGLYEAMLDAKSKGLIRHIGITNHRLNVAVEAVESGLYETLQFPFSYLATNHELNLVDLCKEKNVGFLAMKGLAGGTITNASAAFAYIYQFDNVLPLWGIQSMDEINEFISFHSQPPMMDETIAEVIERDRKALSGSFCRGCGYCMPCPAEIKINNCARTSLLLRRAPSAKWLSDEWKAEMMKIKNCIHCNKCIQKCPYHLNTPTLLQDNLKDYEEILAGKSF